MGVPRFAPHTLKLSDGAEVIGVEVSTGNPHFVILVDNADFAVAGAWQTIGAEICTHRDFPHQTNVEFVRIVSEHEIEIRIFERGVGPTTSSGTGSSAAATAALALRRCLSPLTVVAPGGAQTVAWDGPGTELHLTGPAALIAARRGMVKWPPPQTAAVAPGAAISIVAPASPAKPERVERGLAELPLSASRRKARPNALCAARSTSPELPLERSPISTPHSPIPTPAPSWPSAAATAPTTCSTASIST
jgi:hypothetical protein